MAKKLWGGRFEKEVDKDFFEFQKSIHYDYKLAKYDVVHSLLHVMALGDMKVLSASEQNKLLKALNEIRSSIKSEKFQIDKKSEDIHTDIQNKVEKKVGKLALKMHAFRSRNDQIAFDEKAYCYDMGATLEKCLGNLLKSIRFLQTKYGKFSFVGYTHTQRAKKVQFKKYLDAYYCMFGRDKKRLYDFWKNIDIHIGAGALAGSPIEAKAYNKAIKHLLKGWFLVKPSVNTLDDVSNRDYIVEFLCILCAVQMHLSRLAEDFILYSTQEFNFVKLPEEFCTGSSLMPHKKNPDFLELVRGHTGRVYGNLMSILTMMKGLPLTYNRDMQLDKEPLFSSVDIVEGELKIMTRFLEGIQLKKSAIMRALEDKRLYATEEAYKLVLNKKIPFKEAHDIIGKSIKEQEKIEELAE